MFNVSGFVTHRHFDEMHELLGVSEIKCACGARSMPDGTWSYAISPVSGDSVIVFPGLDSGAEAMVPEEATITFDPGGLVFWVSSMDDRIVQTIRLVGGTIWVPKTEPMPEWTNDCCPFVRRY